MGLPSLWTMSYRSKSVWRNFGTSCDLGTCIDRLIGSVAGQETEGGPVTRALPPQTRSLHALAAGDSVHGESCSTAGNGDVVQVRFRMQELRHEARLRDV